MNRNITEELTVFRQSDTYRTVTDTPGLEIREQDGKFGIVNRRGQTVVPFRYHNLYSIGAGQIVLCRFGKCGLLRILWDAQNHRYLLRQTARCDYDSIEAVTQAVFVFRRRGRYAWHLVRNGSTSGEYRAVRVIGDRFVQGIRSDYEPGILCDLRTGNTYPASEDEECCSLGSSAAYDFLLCRRADGKCRVMLFDERGEVRRTDWCDDVSPLVQTAPDAPPRIKCLFVREDDRVTVTDDRGAPVATLPVTEKLRAVIASDDREIWAKSAGFGEWDLPPRQEDTAQDKPHIALARRALYAGDYLPPMRTYGEEPRVRRKWGTLRAGNASRIRREIRKLNDENIGHAEQADDGVKV